MLTITSPPEYHSDKSNNPNPNNTFSETLVQALVLAIIVSDVISCCDRGAESAHHQLNFHHVGLVVCAIGDMLVWPCPLSQFSSKMRI